MAAYCSVSCAKRHHTWEASKQLEAWKRRELWVVPRL
jgi:hypothetical protein